MGFRGFFFQKSKVLLIFFVLVCASLLSNFIGQLSIILSSKSSRGGGGDAKLESGLDVLREIDRMPTLVSSQEMAQVKLPEGHNDPDATKLVLMKNFADFYMIYKESMEPQCAGGHKCIFTENPRFMPMEEFDAIAYNIPSVIMHAKGAVDWWKTFPKKRSPHQVYIFHSLEAPFTPHNFIYTRFVQPRDFPYKAMKDYFNWTWTYRHDSDVITPYGWIQPKWWFKATYQNMTGLFHKPWWQTPSREKLLQLAEALPEDMQKKAKRLRKVLWIVSHCYTRSRRHEYALELQKYIPVSVYGSCGEKTDDASINLHLSTHKFYLSFENSICKDYVTEKFFARMQYILPIVMGGAQWTKIAPPHSYINVDDFDSPAHLAEHLHFLDRNPQEYLSYFWWTEQYATRYGQGPHINSLCRICQMLHNPKEERRSVDLEKWWWEGSQCREEEHWWKPRKKEEEE